MKKPNTKKPVQPEKKPYKEAECGNLLLCWLGRTIKVMHHFTLSQRKE
jgi:hypothetical protein